MNINPKITVITVTYNAEEFLEDCIESVKSQKYNNVEYIIVDGQSKDSTLKIIKRYFEEGVVKKYISEPDNGLYDAMNKGIELATGNIIAFLNADDMYFDNTVLEKVASAFKNAYYLYGDVVYIKRQEKGMYFRYWRTGDIRTSLLKYGWQIPHPVFFIKSEITKKEKFNTNFEIAADHDFIVRVITKYRNYVYLRYPLVKMRFGGKSSKNINSMVKGNKEIKKILLNNGIKPSRGFLLYRVLSRLRQIIDSKIYSEYLKKLEAMNK